MAIVELDQAKTQLNIALDNEIYDTELPMFIDAATIAVETARGQAVDSRPVVDTVTLRHGAASFLLSTTPVLAVTAVSSADGGTSWPVDALTVDGATGLVTIGPGSGVTGTVRVSYTAGMNPVPANFTLAALIILEHLWETRRGAMGVQMAGTDDYMPGPGFAIPRRALELIGLSMPGVA